MAIALALGMAWLAAPQPAAAVDGAALFQAKCSACHTIGSGRLVGPDLAGVGDRRPHDWIAAMIRSPQAMIAKGDPVAKKLLAEFQVPMPDQGLSEPEVQALVAFLTGSSKGAQPVAKPAGAPPGDPARGLALFVGRQRLQNGGPPCASCHAVEVSGVSVRGALARDLTGAATRLGSGGIAGVLSGMPFPAMRTAYGRRPLTDEEQRDLAAFLAKAANAEKSSAGAGALALTTGGVAVAGLLLLAAPAAWSTRRRDTVNRSIFERQVRSSK